MLRIIRGFGRGLRNGLVAIGALAFLGTAVGLADYAATQGSGTNFASLVISSVHYAAHVLCDATAGESQCAAVNSHGALDVDTATSNNNLYSALTAAVPCLNATAYNTNSYSTGQTNPANCDTQGNLYTSNNVVNWGGVALGAMANYGSSPGAVKVPGVNAYVTNTPSVALNTTPTVANGNGVVPSLVTSGGYTTYFLQPIAGDNHTNVKNGAGQVYWVLVENNSATVNYLRLYNAASGFNGCNSATNLITQIQIPASTSVGGVNIPLPFGIPFSTGISICVTSGYATTDTTNATATAISLTIGYN
jgi:hypothetical protein